MQKKNLIDNIVLTVFDSEKTICMICQHRAKVFLVFKQFNYILITTTNYAHSCFIFYLFSWAWIGSKFDLGWKFKLGTQFTVLWYFKCIFRRLFNFFIILLTYMVIMICNTIKSVYHWKINYTFLKVNTNPWKIKFWCFDW